MPVLKTVLLMVVFAVIGGIIFVYSGVYHMGADEPHWTSTTAAIEALRDRSIAVRSKDVEVPQDLADPERIRRGAGNYDAMCVGCHLAPGRKDSEIRKGLYPQPPNLALPAVDGDSMASPANQFWVIKHGLKMSGMPAWGMAGVDDETIWDMVALLPQLSSLSPDGYRQLVASSAGHSHAGAPMKGHDRGTMPAAAMPDENAHAGKEAPQADGAHEERHAH